MTTELEDVVDPDVTVLEVIDVGVTEESRTGDE